MQFKGGFCEEKWWTLYSDAIVDPGMLDQSVGGCDKIDRVAGHSFQLVAGATVLIFGMRGYGDVVV